MYLINVTIRGVVFLLFSMTLTDCSSPPKEAGPTNIIIIYADDLGYGDLSCYNVESKISTTHLDKLAKEGIMFTDAHSAAAVCTPSRYALLTGRYPFRSSLKSGVLWTYARPLIPRDQPTVATMLKQTGYHTGIIGKWHLGFTWPTDKAIDDQRWEALDETGKEALINFRKALRDGPRKLGFDYFFGMDTPNFPPYGFFENGMIVGETPVRLDSFKIKGGVPGVQQRDWKNENILPTLGLKSLDFIEKSVALEKPFFLLMSLTAPHTPIAPNLAFQGKSKAGDYGDLVLEVDDLVGKVVELLKYLQIDDNTLIIFTSDNGSPGHFAQDSGYGMIFEKYGHKTNGPFRGLKGDSWEAGHRVPFIVRWPAKIKGPQTSDRLICQTDIVATLAELVGVDLSEPLGTDSQSFYHLLLGDQELGLARNSIVHQSSEGDLSIRKENWKLILGKGSGGMTAWIDTDDGKSPYEGQLYDLSVDLQEQNNLYGNADYQPKIDELSKLLKEIRNQDVIPVN